MAKINNQNKSLSGSSNIKSRLIFLLMALFVYRIGTHIPVPGINTSELANMINNTDLGVLSLINLFSGGALERFSVMALGIWPYISASIIISLMTAVFPSMSSMQKEGGGKAKMMQYTRYLTIPLALMQAFGVAVTLESQNLALSTGLQFKLFVCLMLTTGTMFLMWLGEQITERGIGNGISMIIFIAIASGFPSGASQLFDLVSSGAINEFMGLIILLVVIFLIVLVVFVERAMRKIPLGYAKQYASGRGFNSNINQGSHLPLKLNVAGIIPPIFASAILSLPVMISSWSLGSGNSDFLNSLNVYMSKGTFIYNILLLLAIIFFSYFYTSLMFNGKNTADNLKKSGAVVPGIRPGDHTAKYIDGIVSYLTFFAAIYLSFITIVPDFMISKWDIPFYFGGTTVLILVIVSMDFLTQIQSMLVPDRYGSLLKKNKSFTKK